MLFLFLALVGLKVLPLYLTAWVLPGLLIPLLQPSEVHALMSMPRFVLVLFPLFIVLGKLIRPRVHPDPVADRLRLPPHRAHHPVRALVLGIVTGGGRRRSGVEKTTANFPNFPNLA